MKNIFDMMSDNAIGLTGAAFALAVEREIFKEYLVKEGVLTAEEILLLHYAALNKNVKVLRDMLNKINDFMEDNAP